METNGRGTGGKKEEREPRVALEEKETPKKNAWRKQTTKGRKEHVEGGERDVMAPEESNKRGSHVCVVWKF